MNGIILKMNILISIIGQRGNMLSIIVISI